MSSPQKQNTLLMPSGPVNDLDKKHLFIIVTDACKSHQHILIPVCSIKEERYTDMTCVLTAGEHEFLKIDSYIHYALTKQKHIEALKQGIANGNFILKDDVSDPVFKRVCDGIVASKHTPRWAKRDFLSWPN
jgi:hypothetical protein